MANTTATRKSYTHAVHKAAAHLIASGEYDSFAAVGRQVNMSRSAVANLARRNPLDVYDNVDPNGVTLAHGHMRHVKMGAIRALRPLLSAANAAAKQPTQAAVGRAAYVLQALLDRGVDISGITHTVAFGKNFTHRRLSQEEAARKPSRRTSQRILKLVGASVVSLKVGDSALGLQTRSAVLFYALVVFAVCKVPVENVLNADHARCPDNVIGHRGVVLDDEIPNPGATVTERGNGYSVVPVVTLDAQVVVTEVVTPKTSNFGYRVYELSDQPFDFKACETIAVPGHSDAGKKKKPGAMRARDEEDEDDDEEEEDGDADDGDAAAGAAGAAAALTASERDAAMFEKFTNEDLLTKHVMWLVRKRRGLHLAPLHPMWDEWRAVEADTLTSVKRDVVPPLLDLGAALVREKTKLKPVKARPAKRRKTRGRGRVQDDKARAAGRGRNARKSAPAAIDADSDEATTTDEEEEDDDSAAPRPHLTQAAKKEIVSAVKERLDAWAHEGLDDLLTNEARRILAAVKKAKAKSFDSKLRDLAKVDFGGEAAWGADLLIHSTTKSGLASVPGTMETFRQLRARVFTDMSRHLVFLLDNCNQFKNAAFLALCRELNISVLIVPSKCTGAFQPLDMRTNARLKVLLKEHDRPLVAPALRRRVYGQRRRRARHEQATQRIKRVIECVKQLTRKTVADSWLQAMHNAKEHAQYLLAWAATHERAAGRNYDMSGAAGTVKPQKRFSPWEKAYKGLRPAE